MSIAQSIKNACWISIHPAGYPFISFFLILSLVLGLFSNVLLFIGLILTAWCSYFFRDPERIPPELDSVIVSPADGIVSFLGPAPPPKELQLPIDKKFLKISIFMNMFNCHINRSPIRGHISDIHYIKGKFINAELDKSSEHNERNIFCLTNNSTRIIVVQIAGFVARRILFWVKKDQELKQGERLGLIRFGSRLDVYVDPQKIQPKVKVGQTTIAGETIIFELKETIN